MAKFVVCLVLCLAALISTGFALTCYNCHSQNIEGCLKSASPKSTFCGNPQPGYKSLCYYKQSYDSFNKADSVNASCGMVNNFAALNTFSGCQQVPGIQIKECRVCDTDLCNSAPVFSTSFFALLCLPVMYFVTKFILH